MAITDSAVSAMKPVGAFKTPRVLEVLVTAIKTESGDLEIEHNQGRACDMLEIVQLTGDAADLVSWKRASDTEDSSFITLGTVASDPSATFQVFLHFYGDNSPDVTE